jgi:NhaP-type Na+/H+ or K+/H+ antiporter
VSAAFIYAFIPNLNFLSSLAIAACLTPTDPILAAAIVGGKYADKHVPAHLRHILAAESASNDSAAYVYLFFTLYFTLDRTTGGAIKDWLLVLWLCACNCLVYPRLLTYVVQTRSCSVSYGARFLDLVFGIS